MIVQAHINDLHREESPPSSGEETDVHFIDDPQCDEEEEFGVCVIECDGDESVPIAEIQAASHFPQKWDDSCQSTHVEDARLMRCQPEAGMAHFTGKSNLTSVSIEDNNFSCLLESGASCSIVSQSLLCSILPNLEDKLLPIKQAEFHSCSHQLVAVGVIPLTLIFLHTSGSVRMQEEFLVIRNVKTRFLIMGNDYLTLDGFDITNSKTGS